MNADVINAFIIATHKVLRKQFDIPFAKGVIEVKPRNAANNLLACCVELSGTIEGCVTLRLTKKLLALISATFNTNDKDAIEIRDAIVGLVKITGRISDIVKENINGTGIIIGTPQMVPKDKHPPFPLGVPVISMSFKTHHGDFFIESAYTNHLEETALVNERI